MTEPVAEAVTPKRGADDFLRPVPEPDKQAVLYLRVSTKRQMDTAADVDPEGNSIATQREVSLAKARQLSANVVKEFVEPGTSAQTIEKRPVFREMIAYLTEYPGVDYVIIYMRSRAFRNFGDAVITKRRLERMQIKLLSAKEDFGEGIMADAMEAVTDIINEVQVRMSGEDIKVKMRHKAESGGTISRARLGYKNIRVEHEGRLVNTVGLDDERGPLIRTAWELYSTGEYTIDRLFATMADLGLTNRASRRTPEQPVAASQLHRMLSDPYYTGVVVYKGEIFPGRHPAIVSQELFDRVQDVLAARSGRGQRDRVLYHYLKGILFCDRCRRAGRTSRLIYTEAKGRGGTIHPYYLCRGRQDKVCDLPHLPVALVERAVVSHYALLRLAPEFVAETIDLIDRTMQDEQRAVRDLHANYRKQLKALDVREDAYSTWQPTQHCRRTRSMPGLDTSRSTANGCKPG
jgi:site-specific DNA recombinase